MRTSSIDLEPLKSSFLSCEKDVETILSKLFIESGHHSEELKRLLVINTKDCLSNKTSELYKKAVSEATISKLFSEGYIKLTPKIYFEENSEVKAYILISFDQFMENISNPEYRNHNISFDIICHTDTWDLTDFAIRPLKIAGYIDGILNKSRLSGIGQLNFLNCSQIILDKNLAGYSLTYVAINGNDDRLYPEE